MGYLFPWQRRIRDDIVDGPNKYGVLEKSRRIGGTWIIAIAAVMYCLKFKENCWFSTLDEPTGKEFIRYVKAYCGVVNAILGFGYIDLKDATTTSVELPNGSRISSVSSNPDVMRAKDGLIVLDEFAIHEDQLALYTAAQGCVAQKGKLWMLSTHKGPTTLFYQLCREAEAGKENWSHHRITLVDAVAQGYARKFVPHKTDEQYIESIRRGCLSEEAFGQEFMCRPLSLSSLISADQYDALAIFPVTEALENKDYRPLVGAIDVGRVHDHTVIWIAEEYENPKAEAEHERREYKTVAVKSIRNTDFPTQAAMLRPLIGHRSVRRVLIDEGAVGRALADAFCDEFPDRVEAYSFTQPRKAALAERLKGYVEAKRISLPPDPQIREQFLAMQRSASNAGNLVYEGRTRDTHCDAFWAAAMMLEAAGEPGLVIV